MKKVLGKKIKIIKKKRLSVRMPKSMIIDIEHRIKTEYKSVKFRSKWISAAIDELSQDENYSDLIAEEWIEPGKNEIIQITLDPQAEERLNYMDKKLNEIIHNKDISSSIVRTAILQKLIKGEGNNCCPDSGQP